MRTDAIGDARPSALAPPLSSSGASALGRPIDDVRVTDALGAVDATDAVLRHESRVAVDASPRALALLVALGGPSADPVTTIGVRRHDYLAPSSALARA